MKKLLLLTVICFTYITALAQSRTITRTLTGDGNPLNGATITINEGQRSLFSYANDIIAIYCIPYNIPGK